MTFLHPLPWWLLGALVAAAVAWAMLAAGGARSTLAGRQRLVLMLLRLGVALLFLVILMRPVVMGRPQGDAGPVMAILVDASRSMSLADDGGASRFERALALARNTIAPALSPQFAAQVFSFGESLDAIDEATSSADHPLADLDAALLALPSAVGSDRLAGVVVLSDGGLSIGPSRAFTRLGVPVLTVGVGAREGYRDREVLDVSMGDPTFAESTLDVSATVVSRGLGDGALDVTVLADEVPVDTRRVPLAGDGVPARTTVQVRPASDRAVRFTVRLTPASRELTLANNEASVLVPPTRRRARVLLVEGAPGFEHSFLKRALERDAALSVDAVVPKGRTDRGDAAFYVQAGAERAEALETGWPSDRAALFAYDAVVLANASLRALSRGQLDQLTEFVSRRGGGLVTLGAEAVGTEATRGLAFADVVPIDPLRRSSFVTRASREARAPGTVWLTHEGEDHPVMRLPGAPGAMRDRWTRLPRLSAVKVAGYPRPGASVLARVTGPAGDLQPLVTVQRYGRGRVLSFTGEASWRWRMMTPSDDESYETFWRQVMRWVAAPAPARVEIAASESVAGLGELFVDLHDAEYAPVADARVMARVSGPSGEASELKVRPAPDEPGRYRARFDTRTGGQYRVTVEPVHGRMTFDPADAWTLAGAYDREARDPRRNDEILRRVAEAGGGRLIDAASVATIGSFFENQSARPSRRAPVDLWHNGWTLLLLIGLLCLEWGLRRRWGLR